MTYDWRSDLDGLLGSEARYGVRTSNFMTGTHTISVRAQNDEGVWSAPLTTTVQVKPTWLVFLPLLVR